jgi:hypothetical protein
LFQFVNVEIKGFLERPGVVEILDFESFGPQSCGGGYNDSHTYALRKTERTLMGFIQVTARGATLCQ